MENCLIGFTRVYVLPHIKQIISILTELSGGYNIKLRFLLRILCFKALLYLNQNCYCKKIVFYTHSLITVFKVEIVLIFIYFIILSV